VLPGLLTTTSQSNAHIADTGFMAQSMLIWGLGKQDWRRARAIVSEHGNRGFLGLWKVMHWSSTAVHRM
jgi:hypothetical protein